MSDEATILDWFKAFKKQGASPDPACFPLPNLESIAENGTSGIYRKDGQRHYFWVQTDQWINDHTVPLSNPEVYLTALE